MAIQSFFMYMSLSLSLIFTCQACSDNFEKPIKGSPGKTGTETVLGGSFESKFTRYAEGDVFLEPSSHTWSDTLWMNDRTHKQLILWIEKGSIGKLAYRVSDLRSGNNSIDKNNVQLRFCSYVKGDDRALDCGMQSPARTTVLQADALSLIPVTSLSDRDPLKIWITVNVPSGAVPGKYEGDITVYADGVEQKKFNLEILVVNHELPAVKDWTFHLDLWQFPFQLAHLVRQNGNEITPFSSAYYKMMKPFYTMLADAGQTAITTYIKDGAFDKGQTMVKWIKETDDNWNFDYSDFDKHVETMMQWGITKQINCFSLVGWHNSIGYYDKAALSEKILDINVNDPEYGVLWDSFLSSFHTHLNEKGWFEKTVLYMDEIDEEEMEKVVQIIKNNNVNWKIGLAGKQVHIGVAAQLYEHSIILDDERTLKVPVSTFYTSCSQTIPNNYVTSQNSTSEMTWMAWYAAANNYDGYLRWAYDYWINPDPFDIQDGTNTAGDFSMIYRSDNTLSSNPVSSIRLELLREGIQDYEKIKILSHVQLNTCLNEFNKTSGIDSRNLVEKGQCLLKRLSIQE